MNEGIMQPTLPAVQCSVCKQLYQANALGYVLLTGRLLRPGVDERYGRNRYPRRAVDFGDENKPTVVCDNLNCIGQALGRNGKDDDY